MIVFLACSGMMVECYSDPLRPLFVDKKGFDELRSYFELRWFDGHTLPVYGRTFFFDSGAFSAWSQGEPVDRLLYAKFLEKYAKFMTYYANLDAIPSNTSPEGYRKSAQDTLDNQKFLEDHGLQPVPVFHKGEPFEFLEMYVEKYPYICLGGLVSDATAGTNKEFFDFVWARFLTKPDGTPKTKVHAFGTTGQTHLLNYPWFSADSSTWLIQSKTGCICVPKKKDGQWDYNVRPHLVAVSDRSSFRGTDGEHFDTMPKSIQDEIVKYVIERGCTMENVCTLPQWRFVINWYYWLEFAEKAKFQTTFKKRQVEFV